MRGFNKELEKSNITNGFDYSLLEELVRVMKKINIYIWCNQKQIPIYLDYFVTQHKCNFDILVWGKTNAMPTFFNKYLSDKEYCLYFRKGGYCNPANYNDAKTIFMQSINVEDKNKYKHPTIKPLNIIKTLVKNSSKEGDVILDTFMGSGTTCKACQETNRQYIGFEINEQYYNIAKDRLNNINARGEVSLF